LDRHRQKIDQRMAAGFDINGLAVQDKAASNDAGPHIQRLVNGRDGFGCDAVPVETQPDSPEVQPMRIVTKTIIKVLLPRGAGRVSHLSAISIKGNEPEICRPAPIGIRK
jgi:hypothetical protein